MNIAIMKNDTTYRPITLVVVGVVLIGLSLLAQNGDIERALVSDPSRSLAWGPSLFRALLFTHGLALLLIAVVWRRRLLSAHSAGAKEYVVRGRGKIPWVVLGGLSVLAIGLRIFHLNSDLWYDEVLTLLDFVRPSLGDIVTSFPSQNQHMLYSLLAHVSVNIFGESAWALRLPSVIFGVASVWALFLLGRRVVDAREALLACGLMTVSYHHIWFSQNARGYMGLMFFSTLATWLWLEALSRDSWPLWISYAVALTLGMWLHMTMAFVVAAHGLIYLIDCARKRKLRWKPFGSWLLFASLSLQLHALSLPEFLRTGLHEISLESEWTNPLWVVTESMRSLAVGFSGGAVLVCGAALVSLGWVCIVRNDWKAGVAMVLPALVAGLTMLVLGHNLWPRFFFFSMGFALLIVVRGAMMAPRLLLGRIKPLQSREGLIGGAGLALTSMMIIASSLTVPRCYALPKQDFTGARDYVEHNRGQRDAVVSIGLAGGAYGRYFARQWMVAETRTELRAIQQEHERTWLVYTIPIQVKAYCPDIWEEIENSYKVVKVFPGTLGGGELYVCQKQQAAQLSRN
jgi:hypothetical protein